PSARKPQVAPGCQGKSRIEFLHIGPARPCLGFSRWIAKAGGCLAGRASLLRMGYAVGASVPAATAVFQCPRVGTAGAEESYMFVFARRVPVFRIHGVFRPVNTSDGKRQAIYQGCAVDKRCPWRR